MGKILVVAEKPSVGRDIAKVLKCTGKTEGALVGENYIVSWAVGHLITLFEPDDYDQKYKKWSVDTLPILPEKMKLKPIASGRSQLKILKKLMNDSQTDSIICATDSGREGELIFRYIYDYVRCKKPVQRLWISSMTDMAIREGFQNLKDSREYDSLYESARCRSEADWLVGMNASRAYTITYHSLLSIGRVQTPTLALIVKRKEEIDSFVPTDYYEVKADYGDFFGLWYDAKDKTHRISDLKKAEEIFQKVKQKTAAVKEIKEEEKRQPAPLLYDLTELQRDCNRRYGFTAQKTLNIAQKLYETRKLITYPRTDSRYLSDDMIPKIRSTMEKMNSHPRFQPLVAPILELDKLPISKRIVNNARVTDHHAIIPSDVKIKIDKLESEEQKVYGLIALRFAAVFYPPYITEVKTVCMEAEKEIFLSKGTTVKQKGWMKLYEKADSRQEKENQKEQDAQALPILSPLDTRIILRTEILKKKTQPPKPYTEATLLSAMENAGKLLEDEDLKEQMKDSGLGTPATRASIIERLLKVGYLYRKGKTLLPSPKGESLIQLVPEQLKSPMTTGKWEKGLSSISKGSLEPQRFMDSIKRFVLYLIEESAKEQKEIVFEKEERPKRKRALKGLGECPLCHQGKIFENAKAFYCSQWKAGCKFTIWKDCLDRYGSQISAEIVKKLLKDGQFSNIQVTLPQTQEKCTADLRINTNCKSIVELINLERIKNEDEK